MADKIQLKVSMIKKINEVYGALDVGLIDLSPFSSFEKDTLEVGSVLDSIQIESLANKSKKIMTICKNYSAVVFALLQESKRRLDHTKAKICLGEAEDVWSKKQEESAKQDDKYKPKSLTESMRECIMIQNDSYQIALLDNIKWKALDKWFSDTMRDLENSHNWYKKLFDKIMQNKD